MNPASWCIKNNRTAILVFLLVVGLGIQSFLSLPRLEDPEFIIRTAAITTVFPGASPIKVEQLVTDKLEKKIREMPEVDNVISQSMTSVSIIFVTIKDRYTDMKPLWDKLRIKINDAAGSLPQGVETPVVNDEYGDVFGIVVALSGDGYTYREMKDTADLVRDELLTVQDVAKVEFFGVQDERIFIDFSNARGAQYGFGPGALANVLQTQNIVQPGGNALVGPERVVIEPTGEFKSLEQIQKTTIQAEGRPESLYIEDIADVSRGFVDPPDSLARMNHERAIILAVSMARGGKITELGPRVMKRLEEITADLPLGLDFDVLCYQPYFVDNRIKDFLINLAEAFFFVFIVVLLFAGARTGLVVGLLVPMAMLVCFILMPVFNVVLEQISIASLIIALGILVDNGVVVGEEILVRMSGGEDRFTACTRAVKDLATPMLGASLSTIFAFMPIATAKSAVGEYCFSLFVVITLTLLASWALALTMVPLAGYYFLKPQKTVQTFSSFIYRTYRNFVVLNLKTASLHVILVIGLTAFSLWAFNFVPKIFFPPNEREMFYIDLYQPYGTDIRETAKQAALVESFLFSRPETASAGTFVGNGGPRWYLSLPLEDSGSHYARIVVNTKDLPGVNPLIKAAEQFMTDTMPETRFVISQLSNGPSVGAAIQVRLSGPDIAEIYQQRDRIKDVLYGVLGVVNVRDDWGEWTKKLVVNVNQEKAKQAGLTSQDIAQSLQTQISGLPVTEFREGKEVIPVVLRSEQAYREDLGAIEDMSVYSFSDGRSLPLAQVAATELTWQPSNIQRRDARRTMVIKAGVEGRNAQEANADVMARLAELTTSPEWPSAYRIDFGGEFEESAKAQDSITAGLPLAGGLILLLLVWQFNSIRRMAIIVLTIPPMMFGITFGLLLTDAPFGFMAMLGMISLTGIIINNAIILIDSIEKEKKIGQSAQDAIVLSAQKRLRPIIMTTATTIVGLIPLSLQGGEMFRPMANTLIFGLAFATILTLFLCPVLYKLLFRVDFKTYQWDPAVLELNRQ